MTRRSQLKAELKELRRQNKILRDVVEARSKKILLTMERKWLGVARQTVKVSEDGQDWAVVSESILNKAEVAAIINGKETL